MWIAFPNGGSLTLIAIAPTGVSERSRRMLYKGFKIEPRQAPSGDWVARIHREGSGRLTVDGRMSEFLDTIESATANEAVQLARMAIDVGRVRL
jgi:hypothetical protein